MVAGHVFIATSLDGFIARSDGDIDWLDAFVREGDDNGYYDFIAGMDGLVMGRGTYEKVLSFGVEWPYSIPVVVLSSGLSGADVPSELEGRVRIMNGAPTTVLAQMDAEGWKNVYVDGGRVIQSFLRAGLIETLDINRAPILLGEGIPLFGALGESVVLEHLGTTASEGGFVRSRYRVISHEDRRGDPG